MNLQCLGSLVRVNVFVALVGLFGCACYSDRFYWIAYFELSDCFNSRVVLFDGSVATILHKHHLAKLDIVWEVL